MNLTVVLYVLVTLWTLGVFGALSAFIVCEFETWVGRIVLALIGIPFCTAITVPMFFAIQHEDGPVLATLLKSEWQCQGGHNMTTTSAVMSGKVAVPIQTTSFVCDVYVRGATP